MVIQHSLLTCISSVTGCCFHINYVHMVMNLNMSFNPHHISNSLLFKNCSSFIKHYTSFALLCTLLTYNPFCDGLRIVIIKFKVDSVFLWDSPRTIRWCNYICYVACFMWVLNRVTMTGSQDCRSS